MRKRREGGERMVRKTPAGQRRPQAVPVVPLQSASRSYDGRRDTYLSLVQRYSNNRLSGHVLRSTMVLTVVVPELPGQAEIDPKPKPSTINDNGRYAN